MLMMSGSGGPGRMVRPARRPLHFGQTVASQAFQPLTTIDGVLSYPVGGFDGPPPSAALFWVPDWPSPTSREHVMSTRCQALGRCSPSILLLICHLTTCIIIGLSFVLGLRFRTWREAHINGTTHAVSGGFCQPIDSNPTCVTCLCHSAPLDWQIFECEVRSGCSLCLPCYVDVFIATP